MPVPMRDLRRASMRRDPAARRDALSYRCARVGIRQEPMPLGCPLVAERVVKDHEQHACGPDDRSPGDDQRDVSHQASSPVPACDEPKKCGNGSRQIGQRAPQDRQREQRGKNGETDSDEAQWTNVGLGLPRRLMTPRSLFACFHGASLDVSALSRRDPGDWRRCVSPPRMPPGASSDKASRRSQLISVVIPHQPQPACRTRRPAAVEVSPQASGPQSRRRSRSTTT